jgi:hypothetical protein
MATYTLRCTMQLVTSPASLSVKYLQNRSGVRFAQPFLVGLPQGFPFHTGAAKKLTFGQSPIITVIGKAFWDVGHAPKDQSNRRKYMPDYAVWEIHPVMKLNVQETTQLGE